MGKRIAYWRVVRDPSSCFGVATRDRGTVREASRRRPARLAGRRVRALRCGLSEFGWRDSSRCL